jgi:hypothetical protein
VRIAICGRSSRLGETLKKIGASAVFFCKIAAKERSDFIRGIHHATLQRNA